MAEFIDEFAKVFADDAAKEVIEQETKKMFQNTLKLSEDEVSTMFRSESFVKEGGIWKLNGATSEEVVSHMRSGKLSELLDVMKIEGSTRLKLLEKQQVLESMVRDCPEYHLTKLENKVDGVAKDIKELHQNIDELKEMSEPVQRRVVDAAANERWLKKIKPGRVLTTALLAIGIAEIIEIKKSMTGCYLYRMDNGTLKKYKIKNRSFDTDIPPNANDYADLKRNPDYLSKCMNLTLLIRQAFYENHEILNKLKDPPYNISTQPSGNALTQFINEHAADLQGLFAKSTVKVSEPRAHLQGDEKKMNCIACDHSAPIDSVSYASRTGLASNETLHCVDNVTIYEAFKNFGEEVLIDVVDGLSKLLNLNGLLLIVGKFLLLFVVLLLIGNFAITYFTKSNHYEKLEEEEQEIQMKSFKAA